MAEKNISDKIKKFFEKKKSEAKFKMAGPGHKLNEMSKPKGHQSRQPAVQPRAPPSNAANQAGSAALARLEGGKKHTPAFNTSLAAIQAQVRRELEAEKLANAAAAVSLSKGEKEPTGSSSISERVVPSLACHGVYFRCPIISDEVLSKEEWKSKIKEFLYEQLSDEQALTACMIIHSCNRNRDKVKECVDTLCKYLDNIIKNITEEKYRRIRMSNRVFSEKIAGMEGAMEFLTAAGFQIQNLPFQDSEEPFLVFPEEKLEDLDTLHMLIDALNTVEPIALELDRNVQVLLPSQAAKRTNLPYEFFRLTPEEIKKEQQQKTEKVEECLMLRTKAMRERDEQKELKKYKFALIRIRFPNGVFLQGTFGIYENLSEVLKFVKEHLEKDDTQFAFVSTTGQRIKDSEYGQSLMDLKLVPTAVLTFISLDEKNKSAEESFLKPETMMLVQEI